jgi:hypothetical protein
MADIRPLTEVHGPLLERLGAIVYRWAFIEWVQGEFLGYLLHADKGRIYLITQSISGATITGWLRTLAPMQFTHPTTQAGLNDLFTRIDAARGERNAYVHGLWTSGTEPGIADVMTLRLDRQEVMRRELVDQSDLDGLLEEIEYIYTELVRIGIEVGFHKLPRTED